MITRTDPVISVALGTIMELLVNRQRTAIHTVPSAFRKEDRPLLWRETLQTFLETLEPIFYFHFIVINFTFCQSHSSSCGMDDAHFHCICFYELFRKRTNLYQISVWVGHIAGALAPRFCGGRKNRYCSMVEGMLIFLVNIGIRRNIEC